MNGFRTEDRPLKTITFGHDWIWTAWLWAALAIGGCGPRADDSGSDQDRPPGGPTRVETGSTDYKLVGTVRQVDPEAGEVVIRHEEIPGFMAAMTMPFRLEDRDSLEELHAGDEVEGVLRVERSQGVVKSYQLRDLTVTRPVLASSLDRPAAIPAPKLLEPGQPVPNFRVTTQNGDDLELADLRPNWVVLTFIYTRCPLPDFCPLMDRRFSEIARRAALDPELKGSVRLLSVSFDPEHDTPEVLTRHASRHGAEPPLWMFAVASHEELARVAPPLGMSYAPMSGEIVHNLVTAVIGPDGKLVWLKTGRDWEPPEVVRLIRAAQRP